MREGKRPRIFFTCFKPAEQRVEDLRFLSVRREHGEIHVGSGSRFGPPMHGQATDQTGRHFRKAQDPEDFLRSGSQHGNTWRAHLFVRASPNTRWCKSRP